MARRMVVVGVSLAAFAAGSAVAQTVSVGTNRSTVSQSDTSNSANVSNAAAGNDDNSSGVAQNGNNNAVTVDQVGDTNSSAVTQEGSQHSARVVQGSSVSTASNGNSSSIIQRLSSGNHAEIFQFEGSAAAGNVSFIRQENPGDSASANANNRASVAMRGFGNQSRLEQNGQNNSARVTLLGGGTAAGAQTDLETGRTQGNSSSISQSGEGPDIGRDLTAIVSVGSVAAGEGQGNRSDLIQTGVNHRAEVWQRGLFDSLTIRQMNVGDASGFVDPIKTYSDGVKGRALANVAQKGLRNSAVVAQYGDNSARVTQGLGTRSSVSVRQLDTGDLTPSANNPTGRAFNTAAIAQSGNGNAIDLAQEAVNASAAIWQMARSSFNRVSVLQGPSTTYPTGAISPQGAENARAKVAQGGTRNETMVIQHQFGAQALVEQLGSGTADLPNLAVIIQQGDNNQATARQTAAVGPSHASGPASGQSGDDFYFAGGARSAEIAIVQRSRGNSATVEQRGRGQVAGIGQAGENNRATILQDGAATNATAVILQTGNGNSYSVTQSQPGHYLVVSQTGNNNAATSIVERGPGS